VDFIGGHLIEMQINFETQLIEQIDSITLNTTWQVSHLSYFSLDILDQIFEMICESAFTINMRMKKKKIQFHEVKRNKKTKNQMKCYIQNKK
jgi:hypothetical protein